MKLSKKVAAAVAVGAVTLAGAGVAYAFWTSTGTGSDSSTSTATAGTVTYHSDFAADTLAPGTSVHVDYSASNDTDTNLSVAAPTATVTSDSSYLDNSAVSHSCADFLSLDANPTGGVVPANGSLALGSANLSMDDSTDINQDTCQGQEVTISLDN